MIELTAEQHQAITEAEMPTLIDPETRTEYVLVRKDLFDRLKAQLALDEYDPDEGLVHMNEVMAGDDANDPLLESYQHYRETRS